MNRSFPFLIAAFLLCTASGEELLNRSFQTEESLKDITSKLPGTHSLVTLEDGKKALELRIPETAEQRRNVLFWPGKGEGFSESECPLLRGTAYRFEGPAEEVGWRSVRHLGGTPERETRNLGGQPIHRSRQENLEDVFLRMSFPGRSPVASADDWKQRSDRQSLGPESEN